MQKYVTYIFVALGCFLFDRVTKYQALRMCLHGCDINQYLSFNISFNRGVTWSLFHTSDTVGFVLVTSMVMSITCMLAYYAYQQYRAGKAIYGEVMVLGGSCSNIIDRFLYGGVVDFIELSYGQWLWPSFNCADMAIVIGVGIMMLGHYSEHEGV